MDLVTSLRLLWGRRRALAIGAAIALALAVSGLTGLPVGPLAGGGPAKRAAVISERLMVDTADSELVHVAPRASETLAMRASLWAELLATDAATAEIARQALVPRDQLAVLGPSARIVPAVDTPLTNGTAGTEPPVTEPYVLRVYVDGVLPVVSLEATAPDDRGARSVMTAAVGALRSLVSGAASPGSAPFVVETFAGPRRTTVAARAGGRMRAIAGAAAFYALWCLATVALPGLGRRRARAPVRLA